LATPRIVARRPRIFYGWYIVAASVAVNFYLSVAFFQGFQVFFLPIVREFGWSRAVTSGAFSLRQLESGFLAPVAGFLVDRWGPRPVILIGVALGGVGLILLSFINSLWTFYAAFLIAALGTTGASHGVSWPVAVANWFRRLRGRAMGIAMLGPVVGGPFIIVAAVLEEALGWRGALRMFGVGLLAMGLPISLVARSSPYDYGQLPDGDREAPTDDAGEPIRWAGADSAQLSPGQALRTRAFWVMTALFGAQFMGISGLMVHLIPLLERVDYGTTEAAGIVGLVFLLSGIGRIGAGAMADIVDYRVLIAGLFALQSIALAFLPAIGPSDYVLVGAFALLFGVGFGGTIPLRPFLIARLFGERSLGSIQGLVQGVAVGSGVVGPIFYGWVYDVRGSYDIAIYASLAVVALTAPLVVLLPKAGRAPRPR
jgi:MFS family permease